jgi:glycosyltransferase involved in cell wall biosynthesis
MSGSPSQPLVSIVLGTYNGQAYLREQLDSLFAQTYPRIEIIAIDDVSKDDTVRILHEYAARHPLMKVVVNESNLGFIKNFEKGARISAGDLIAFCDQDDHWLPEKVGKMVASIGEHPMVFCDSELCDQDLQLLGKKISDLAHQESFYDCRQLCVFSRMYGHAILITRKLFDKATPFINEMPHDGWLAFHATLYGGVKFLPEVLVYYRQHGSNIFGAVGGKSRKRTAEERSERKRRELERVRVRMNAFYKACPDGLVPQKKLLKALVESYRDFSLPNDLRRVVLFFANYKWLLTVKRYGVLRKYLFCLKMFIKIK